MAGRAIGEERGSVASGFGSKQAPPKEAKGIDCCKFRSVVVNKGMQVKTHLLELTTLETQTVEGQESVVPVQLSHLHRNLKNVRFTINGHMQSMEVVESDDGSNVWECIWEKAPGMSFPTECQLSFVYTSPMDGDPVMVLPFAGKCVVGDPEVQASGCCSVQ